MGTVSLAGMAADTLVLKNKGAGSVVHLHFSGAGAAAHSDIFDRASETGRSVALKVVQGDKNVGVHNGLPNLGFLHILTVYRHKSFVCSL